MLGACYLVLLCVTPRALAHPGNLSSDGCHYCRTNCTKWCVPENQRHCHGNNQAPREKGKMVLGKPDRIVDGDTLDVRGIRIRLSGIDAPESKQTCANAQHETYSCGEIATQKLRERIGDGSVSCTLDKQDRYERWLGTCTSDGTNLNQWMVKNGYALAYRRYSTQYLCEEAEAESKKRGLWSGTFIEPWRWRRGDRLPGDRRESEGSEADGCPNTPRASGDRLKRIN